MCWVQIHSVDSDLICMDNESFIYGYKFEYNQLY